MEGLGIGDHRHFASHHRELALTYAAHRASLAIDELTGESSKTMPARRFCRCSTCWEKVRVTRHFDGHECARGRGRGRHEVMIANSSFRFVLALAPLPVTPPCKIKLISMLIPRTFQVSFRRSSFDTVAERREGERRGVVRTRVR